MRAVVQRVTEARVRVGERLTGEIARGVVALVGVGRDDSAADAKYIASKIRDLRLFDGDGDPARPMDRSILDVGGAVLLVSQFTLYADVRKGRRPSLDQAATPAVARGLYEEVVNQLRAARIPVATGEFQAMMRIELVNDGPVTILIDSKRHF